MITIFLFYKKFSEKSILSSAEPPKVERATTIFAAEVSPRNTRISVSFEYF